jgi:hypothetical protein
MVAEICHQMTFLYTFNINIKGLVIMNIKNYCKEISISQIKQCIQLLGEPYNSFKLDIIIYDINQEKGLYNSKNNECMGLYYSFKRKVEINTYNFEKKDDMNYVKVQFIITLYHELRHAYQTYYLTKKFVKDLFNKDYENSWSEKDANTFFLRQCIKHNKEINKILNINYNFINCAMKNQNIKI